MKKKTLCTALAYLLVLLLLAGCNTNTPAQTPENSNEPLNQPAQSNEIDQNSDIKVAIIFGIGGLGDRALNDMCYEGIQRASKDFGISFDYMEPTQIADIAVLHRDAASSGEYALIIGVGFEHGDPILEVSAQYPDQKYALVDHAVEAPNVRSYQTRDEESSFLAGVMTALVKQDLATYDMFNGNNTVGFIGAVDVPLIRRYEAGFTAGIASINKDMKVLSNFVGSFDDVTTAKEMALTMYSQGADLVYPSAAASNLGVYQAAQEKSFYALGCTTNWNGTAPDHIFASVVKLLDVAVYEAIESVASGSFSGGTVWLGLADGGVGLTYDESNLKISDEVLAQVEEYYEKIISGAIIVPATMDEVNNYTANLG